MPVCAYSRATLLFRSLDPPKHPGRILCTKLQPTSVHNAQTKHNTTQCSRTHPAPCGSKAGLPGTHERISEHVRTIRSANNELVCPTSLGSQESTMAITTKKPSTHQEQHPPNCAANHGPAPPNEYNTIQPKQATPINASLVKREHNQSDIHLELLGKEHEYCNVWEVLDRKPKPLGKWRNTPAPRRIRKLGQTTTNTSWHTKAPTLSYKYVRGSAMACEDKSDAATRRPRIGYGSAGG